MSRLIEYVWTRTLEHMREEDIRCLDGINIAFGHVVNERVVWEHPECKEALARIRCINPEIKLLLSIGGWSAGGFSEMAFTQQGRETFAADCLQIVKEYGLDGVDIDWEYPCIGVAGIGACPEDKENFTLLLKEIRTAFEAEEKGRYLLTIAAGGDTYFLRNTRMGEAAAYLDLVQIMTYDLRGGFQVMTGHHTSLYATQADLFDCCVDKAVREFHDAGVPMEKIVIGAAFYGRKWEGVPDVNHGLCQMAKTTGGFGQRYGELVSDFINKNGYVRYWDDEAKAPWLYDGNSFISYDDEESLACKIAYVKEMGLGGIMCWEYTNDTTHTLTAYMKRELLK